MRELVEERDLDLVREILGVGEILLQRQPEQADLVGDRRKVGTPLGPRNTLVETIERLVRPDAVVPQLLWGGLLLDHNRDVLERLVERWRDLGKHARDDVLEWFMAESNSRSGADRAAAALDHGRPILRAVTSGD